MITRIVIPQGFENMEEATIGAWLKAEGDTVQAGDALCELITEKTTFDLPAEGAGLLRRIVAPEKSIVPVGFVVGLIGDAGDALPDVAAHNSAVSQRRQQAAQSSAPAPEVPTPEVPAPAVALSAPAMPPPATPSPATPSGGAASGASRLRATPAARRAAREHGIALEDVAAAYPGKVLSEDDVVRWHPP